MNHRSETHASGLAILGIAFFFDSTDCIDLLLDSGVDVSFVPTDRMCIFFGATYLHWASANGNARHVRRLLDMGVSKLAYDMKFAPPWYFNKWGWPTADKYPQHNEEIYELLAIPGLTDLPGPYSTHIRRVWEICGIATKVWGLAPERILELRGQAQKYDSRN